MAKHLLRILASDYLVKPLDLTVFVDRDDCEVNVQIVDYQLTAGAFDRGSCSPVCVPREQPG